MRNAKLYFIFTVLLYVTLIIWGIKGPAPTDYWELEWVIQIIAFNILGFICLLQITVLANQIINVFNRIKSSVFGRVVLNYTSYNM